MGIKLAALLCGVIGGCAISVAAPEEPVRRARWLMGTTCAGEAYGGNGAAALGRAFDEIAALEARLSTWREDSELSRVNRIAGERPAAASAELLSFLETSLGWAAASGGAFDPTVGPLIRLWDVRGGGRISAAAELAMARAQVGAGQVRIDRDAGTVRFAVPGLWIDAGGIGKGWALDRAGEGLRADVDAAVLDFGGQMLFIGSPPEGVSWTFAVARPDDRMRPALLLRVRSGSVATSAQSERGHDVGGRWVGHILDPRTGVPVERDGSVTVVARTATEADALSTALFVMGPDEGLEWAAGQDDVAVGYLDRIPADQDGRSVRLRANRLFQSMMIALPDSVSTRPAPGPESDRVEAQ